IASSAAIDMAVDLPRSLIYLSAGYLDPELYWYIPILACIAFLGSWLGKLLLDRVTSRFFRSLVLFLVFAIGSMMIIKTIFYDA
ncbi:MAG TPA: sulfite exporter TauE/SafE family protein, partial [Flavobacteriales bacterium]|nr:sulfite exporter TauE/SafE family protein [Flavobacteriales bacterium]